MSTFIEKGGLTDFRGLRIGELRPTPLSVNSREILDKQGHSVGSIDSLGIIRNPFGLRTGSVRADGRLESTFFGDIYPTK